MTLSFCPLKRMRKGVWNGPGLLIGKFNFWLGYWDGRWHFDVSRSKPEKARVCCW